MQRNSFIFYRSFYEALKDLPAEMQGEIFAAIMEYALNGEKIEIKNPIAKSIFTLIVPVLDNSLKQYINGSKGGAKKGNQNALKKQPKNNPKTTQKQPNDNPKQPEYIQDYIQDEDEDKDVDEDKDEDVDEDREEEEESRRQKKQEIILQGIVDFYERKGSRYIPDFRIETTATTELVEKIILTMESKRWVVTEDSIKTFWEKFLKLAYNVGDKWQRDHFDIKTINSQYQVFLNKIDNGDSYSNNGITDDYIAAKIKQAAGV